MRRNAFADYSSLPAEVSPLYSKYSDVNRLKPQNIKLPDLNTIDEPYKELSERLKEVEEGKSGVVVTDLRDGLKKFEEKIKSILISNRLNFVEDKFLALEGSIFRGGLFIYISKNLAVDQPIRLINSLSEKVTSSVTRNIVYADSGSKATIIQEMYSPTPISNTQTQQAYFELLECHVGQNASLEMVTLQAMDSKSANFSNRKAFLERDGRMSWYSGMFGSQLSRYKIDSIMKGAGSIAEDVEIIFGVADQSFDVTSNLIHEGNTSRGRVLVKSVMKDASKSLFKGMIKIGKGAK